MTSGIVVIRLRALEESVRETLTGAGRLERRMEGTPGVINLLQNIE